MGVDAGQFVGFLYSFLRQFYCNHIMINSSLLLSTGEQLFMKNEMVVTFTQHLLPIIVTAL